MSGRAMVVMYGKMGTIFMVVGGMIRRMAKELFVLALVGSLRPRGSFGRVGSWSGLKLMPE